MMLGLYSVMVTPHRWFTISIEQDRKKQLVALNTITSGDRHEPAAIEKSLVEVQECKEHNIIQIHNSVLWD